MPVESITTPIVVLSYPGIQAICLTDYKHVSSVYLPITCLVKFIIKIKSYNFDLFIEELLINNKC